MKRMLLVLLALWLGAGCAGVTEPQNDLATTVADFSRRLRWQDVDAATQFFAPDLRDDFRTLLLDQKNLRIADVRVRSLRPQGPERAEVLLAVDYYRLPSPTVKTLTIPQTWVVQGQSRWQPGHWRIVTPFPDIP